LHFFGVVIGPGVLELDEEELLVELEVVVVLDEVDDELEEEDDVDEDDELVVSGTPPGPATICRIFVVVEPKLDGAREI
jgi:hypothetical protein